MKGRRILITGGAGFIGSHVVRCLLAAGAEVGVLDDFNDFYAPEIKRGNLADVLPSIRLAEGDIRDAAAVEAAVAAGRWDAILHLAARAGVRPSISQPGLYAETNVLGTVNVLGAAARHGVPRVVFASSSSVYGATEEAPFREDAPLRRTFSPYAATKVAGEQLCSTFSHLHGLRTVCLRFFTVYGPGQRPDLAIHKFTDRIWKGEPIDQFGDGSSRRDYTYIDDIVQGVVGALNYEGALYDVFNLGESQTITLRELIAALEAALGRQAVIRRLPEQPGDMPATWADISKARALLGYRPGTKISEGIPRFVEWYRAHQA